MQEMAPHCDAVNNKYHEVRNKKQVKEAPAHGIMGTPMPMPNKFSYLRPRPDGKYTTYDHAWTANTIPTW